MFEYRNVDNLMLLMSLWESMDAYVNPSMRTWFLKLNFMFRKYFMFLCKI